MEQKEANIMDSVLLAARQLAFTNGHGFVGVDHFALTIFTNYPEVKVIKEFLQTVNHKRLLNYLNEHLSIHEQQKLEKIEQVSISPLVEHIIDVAKKMAVNNEVCIEHILIALLSEENVDYKLYELLNTTKAKKTKSGNNRGIEVVDLYNPPNINNLKSLTKHGTNLTAQAHNNELDPVIGRQEEIERLIQVLCRRSKNNPVLIGEPGVGKTCIVEGVAQCIVKGQVPDELVNTHLIQINVTSLIAGSRLRGDFEGKLQTIINDVRSNPDIIIFIDELHTIVGAGGGEGSMDLSNIIKPYLARGEIRCIGATTIEEYKHIEQDGALDRRFQPILVRPPSAEETLEILRGVQSHYQDYHNVKYSEDALKAIVELSDKYIVDKQFPDKAITILDEVAAYKKIKCNKPPSSVVESYKKIEEFNAQHAQKKRVSKKVLEDQSKLFQNYVQAIEQWDERPLEQPLINTGDVENVVAKLIKVPLEKIQCNESKKLQNLQDILKAQIVGQDGSIDQLISAYKRKQIKGIHKKNIYASFLVVGPTTTGKSYLTKLLSEHLYIGNSKELYLNMSEFGDSTTGINKLLGSSRGYIDSQKGGILTEHVRKYPNSLIICDHIERSNPDVMNILNQAITDGLLTDSQGKQISFKNTTFIFISTVDTNKMKNPSVMGFVNTNPNTEVFNNVVSAFGDKFTSLMDEVLVFNSLTKENFRSIFDLELNHYFNILKQNYNLEFNLDSYRAKAFEQIYKDVGNTGNINLLKSRIQRNLVEPVLDYIISGKSLEKCNIELLDSGRFKLSQPEEVLVSST